MARTKQVKRSKSPAHSSNDDTEYHSDDNTTKGKAAATKAKLQATKARAAATKAKAAESLSTAKRRKNVDEDSDDEEVTKMVKKAKKDLKFEAVMVTYSIDDTMPELKETYNNNSASVLLSELLDLNSNVRKSDVSFLKIILSFFIMLLLF